MVFVSAGSEGSHGSAGEADELEDTGGDEVAPEPRSYGRRATAILQVNNIELQSEREQDRQIQIALSKFANEEAKQN